MNTFTKGKAVRLAKELGPGYAAKRIKYGTWVVWCQQSDHHVEFDNYCASHPQVKERSE